MKKTNSYNLAITTQGPTYPPSEILNADGDFVVIGKINLPGTESCKQEWGAAIVSKETEVPAFGKNVPYKIIKHLDLNNLSAEEKAMILYTLPLPLPCNNYPMVFAPDQNPAFRNNRNSYPLHEALIPDLRPEDGRKVTQPITLGQWVKAQGQLTVNLIESEKAASFEFEFNHLIPDSLYTIMALRENDLNPHKPTRPGPLGVPNVFITDAKGHAIYKAKMPNPFDSREIPGRNRIINIVVLWMSTQMSYGGAIGHYGLGGDIHAQLKIPTPAFSEFTTN